MSLDQRFTAPPAVDVFLSFKSEDEPHARHVYALLRRQRLDVFFSRESLPQMGSDQYRKQIDAAVDRAHHMVVVTSSRDHVSSRWVEHEWGMFLGELLAGRKGGNLITVLAADMQVRDLPISLRNREVIRWQPEEFDRLIEFTRTKRPALAEPPAEFDAALPVLEELLSGDQDRIRLGLGRMSSGERPTYLAALKAKLLSPSALDRRSSLMALFLLGDPELGASLILAANDREASVRRQALFLIGRARVMTARDVVAVRMSDANPDVRAAAKDAQRKLTGGRG